MSAPQNEMSEPDSRAQHQRNLLAEFGHFYLMLESHEMAAQHCREQLSHLRQALQENTLGQDSSLPEAQLS